jgi:DnaK suppressor protein
MSELSENQLSEIEILLKALEIQLAKDIEEARKSSKPVKLDQQAVGRVSRIDAIQQQQMQLSAIERMKQRLTMVKLALKQVRSDDFGLCKNCEEPIPMERLRARPESTLCIACAKSR